MDKKDDKTTEGRGVSTEFHGGRGGRGGREEGRKKREEREKGGCGKGDSHFLRSFLWKR